MADKEVQFIVETQLLLEPFLLGRQHMHMLYKISRADSPAALCSDFRVDIQDEQRSFGEVQDDALEKMESFLKEEGDINCDDEKGASRLWTAAEQGHWKAAKTILQDSRVDPDKARLHTRTTPLYISAFHGHEEVVKALLNHPSVQVNLGKVGTTTSPLFMAAQEGREGVVEALLGATGIDVNQATGKGITPLIVACEQGHFHIVQLLLQMEGIDVDHETIDGDTAGSMALG